MSSSDQVGLPLPNMELFIQVAFQPKVSLWHRPCSCSSYIHMVALGLGVHVCFSDHQLQHLNGGRATHDYFPLKGVVGTARALCLLGQEGNVIILYTSCHVRNKKSVHTHTHTHTIAPHARDFFKAFD